MIIQPRTGPEPLSDITCVKLHTSNNIPDSLLNITVSITKKEEKFKVYENKFTEENLHQHKSWNFLIYRTNYSCYTTMNDREGQHL